MNKKMITHILGRMLGVEAVVLLIPAFVGVLYGEKPYPFLLTSAILMTLAVLVGIKKPQNTTIYGKEGFVIIASAWILWSVFGAIPLCMSGAIQNYIDALFEMVSGFTTTGATIMNAMEGIPMYRAVHFWRALSHWIGGMGVLVFVLVVVSLEDKHSMHLIRAEVPGPEKDKLVPRARTSAQILYGMYLGLTVIEVIMLLLGGMNLYDSIIHSFSTAGTGGFNNWNNSVAHYDSAYIDGVITVFMILFGINFNMYYFLLLRRVKDVFKNEELRAYLGIIAVAITAITINIVQQYGTVMKAFRYASFQVASIITTTGFVTTDFDKWPEFSKMILLMIMVIGACAGSTGGGVKVSRVLILLKSLKGELKRIIHPKTVTVVKVNDKKVGDDTIQAAFVYLISYVAIVMISVLLVSLDNKSFTANFSGVLTTINNVGPGLAELGPTCNFFEYSSFSKLVFCFDMLIGRLEIFPILILFAPDLWRKKF